jgi:hypothetical protein
MEELLKMARLDFPDNPTINQVYSVGGKRWRWNGTTWQAVTGDAVEVIEIAGYVSYTHVQLSPSNQWVVAHNLNFYPNVMVIDSGGSMVEGSVTQVDTNNVTINFTGAISGKAHLS